MGAGMDTLAQRLGDKLATGGAQLGGVARVYQNDSSASFCRFADGHMGELRPRHIQDAFAHPTALAHLQRGQIFKHDHLIGIDQLVALLVREVGPPICDPLVDTGQDALLLGVLRPVLGLLGRILALLDSFEVGFVAPIEAGVVDLLPVREGGKRRQPHVHAQHMARGRQRLGLCSARAAGEPFADEQRVALQEEVIQAQQAALRELSTPLIPIANGVIAMPLIGTIDSSRAQQMMESLLIQVAEQQAEVAIIDITGVQVVDTQVAAALLRTAQAVQMLGARVVLTGIRPEVAQTLVGIGADLSSITTKGTFQMGIAYALERR